jgi:GDPmannose 4,6-dehydratase
MARIALITGVSGQDGSYLSEFLLAKGYEVHGIVRRSSTRNFERINHLLTGQDGPRIKIHDADLLDQSSLISVVSKVRPTEVYNLAAQSFVHTSWDEATYTGDANALGVTRMLEAIRIVDKGIRFYQASTSELFGKAQETPQTEKTPFYPRSPYGVAKLYGHWITVNYRESYGMYACAGILYNHESPRRGVEFVTRKIAQAAARIRASGKGELLLGNLQAKRDWGHARDFVEAMWLFLQQEAPEDFVIATGEQHSVQEFCELAFGRLGLDWRDHVKVDPSFLRPAEVETLLGDASKAYWKLGWRPRTTFKQLVVEMVDAEWQAIREKAQ